MPVPAYHLKPPGRLLARCPLNGGGAVVIMPKWDATEALGLIEAERVTTAQMVPANFIRILEADWESYDRSSVRKILHAAAPCPVPVKRQDHRRLSGRGHLWESTTAPSEGMASVISPEEWLTKTRGAWAGCLSRTLGPRSWTTTEAEMAPGGRWGPSTSRPSPDCASATTTTSEEDRPGPGADDYFTVGGPGLAEDERRLSLPGRPPHRDLILSGGVNVYPAEVETALAKEDPDVVDAAVFGLPDERMGQLVHAVDRSSRPRAPRDTEALLARLATRLADYKRPRAIEFVPMCSRGKRTAK